MDELQISIKNCNNIDEAQTIIKKGKLNIKYGLNGTGKSTLVSAIYSAVEAPDNLSELVPFKYRADPNEETLPSISGLESVNSVMVFNEEYINRCLFKPDELIENSFSIFIVTPKYEENMREVEDLISGIKETFSNDESLEKVIKDLEQLSASFGKATGSSSIHGSSKLAKSVLKGNPIQNIPDQFESYRTFLTLPENKNVQWLGWHNKGEAFLEESEDCPYCIAPSTEKKEIIKSIRSEYQPKTIEHLNQIMDILDGLGNYFSIDTQDKLKIIVNHDGPLPAELITFLEGVRPDVDQLRDKLAKLRDISFYSFEEDENALEKINALGIHLEFLRHMDSEPSREIVNKLNASLKAVKESIGLLQGKIAIQKDEIKRTIFAHTEDINEFLKYAGYNYYVVIEENGNDYKLQLRYNGVEANIKNTSKHLSYGEKNAFSLILFMFECLAKNPDIIILDDPISSFDKNKKYSIISRLFRGPKSLAGKTVLMVTHDFEPVVDIGYTFYGDFCDRTSISFVENMNGTVNEIQINKEDIKTFGQICDLNIERVQNQIIRAVYLRRYYEIIGSKQTEYSILSSLLKKRAIPSFDRDGIDLITGNEYDEAINNIQQKIPDFDYDQILSLLQNDQDMIEIYKTEANNYEKLSLYRIIKAGDDHPERTIRKFINEAFHIENEYIMQLDPSKYSPVPQYVIDECSEVLFPV